MKAIGKIMILALTLMLLAGCAAGADQPAPQLMEPVGVSMDTAMVQRGDIFEVQAYDFAVEPRTQELYLLSSGAIDEVCVTLGQSVHKGDALVQLDVEAEKEEIERIDAQLSYLEADNALTLEMMQLDIELCRYLMEDDNRNYKADGEQEQLKENELEQLETALRQEQERQALEISQLQEERAELAGRVAQSVLAAPFDGRVVYLAPVTNGSTVQSGQTLVVLADESQLHLLGEFLSPSVVEGADEIWAQVGGARVDITYEPMDSDEYVSQLLSGEEMSTCFAFADGVPEDAQAGDYAAVMVQTRTRKDVLWVPPNCLMRDGAGDYVYRVVDGQRQRVEVTVGHRNPTAVEIEEGLAEGEIVYVQ